jgi:prephenate dehydrogenase
VTVGLIGYGRFGRFAAKHLSTRVRVVVHDPRVKGRASRGGRIVHATLGEAAGQPVVLLAVPVSALRGVLRAIRRHVRPGALIIDVCAVKTLPARWMEKMLPKHVHILATHPLFGPDSASRSLEGKTVVLCPVRLPRTQLREIRKILDRKDVHSIVMSVEEHDRMAAETILLTQYVGRMLLRADLRRWPTMTANYGALVRITDVARRDTPQLFTDMVNFSPHGRRVSRALSRAARSLRGAMRRS